MIAIPLDTKESTVISKLYGNAPFFALLDRETGNFKVVENEELGKGPKSAPYLKKFGVNSTIYYHMGEGVYDSFTKNGMDVYTADHNFYSLDEIYNLSLSEKLIKLDETNFNKLLDPGENSSCKCGCENREKSE